jgi:MFS family permease
VQGVGAAGIGSLTDIIVADLVPLKDRGTFMGILAAVWAVASAIGPTIGMYIRIICLCYPGIELP